MKKSMRKLTCGTFKFKLIDVLCVLKKKCGKWKTTNKKQFNINGGGITKQNGVVRTFDSSFVPLSQKFSFIIHSCWLSRWFLFFNLFFLTALLNASGCFITTMLMNKKDLIVISKLIFLTCLNKCHIFYLNRTKLSKFLL